MPLRRFACVALLATLVSGSALADDYPEFYLGLSAGGHLVLTDVDLGELDVISRPIPIDSSLYAELRLGLDLSPRWAIEASFGYLPFDASIETNDGLDLAVRARWTFADVAVRPYLLFGGGVYINPQPDPDGTPTVVAPQAHYGIGLGPRVADALRLRFEVRHQLTDGIGDDIGMAIVALAGIDLLPGAGSDAPPSDRDGDGVPDDDDRCPDEPGDTANGCPPPADRDGDGVPDERDACPDEAARTPDGCPVKAPADRDGDGVPDASDRCPDEAADTADGCPVAEPADRDGDGVADDDDRCPDVAAPTADGCPPPKAPSDRDGDGVPDDSDACPDVGAPTVDGCPPKPVAKVKVTCDRIEIDEVVLFESGRYEIRADAVQLVDDIARALEAHPEVQKVRITGFTDATGPADFNARLSLKRAWVVREALIERGIAKSRLAVAGQGEANPRASNDTTAGREQNRRVEVDITAADGRADCPKR